MAHCHGMYLAPAQYVILLFGGVCATARAVGRDRSSVSRWMYPTGERGTGGLIPSNLQKHILEVAKARGLNLTADDIVFGRTLTREEIQALDGEDAQPADIQRFTEPEPVRFHFGAKG